MPGGGKPIPECNRAEIRFFLIFGSLIATFIIGATFWSTGSTPHYWLWCGRIFCCVWLIALWRGAFHEFHLRALAGTLPGEPRILAARKKKRLEDMSCKQIIVTMVLLFLYGSIAVAFACIFIFTAGTSSNPVFVPVVFLASLSSIGFGFFYKLFLELRKRAR